MEVVNADVNRLRQVQYKCEAQYLEEEEVVVGDIGDQVPWMQISGVAPQANDAEILHYLTPILDPGFNWVANIFTPFELTEKLKDYLNVKQSAGPNSQRDSGEYWFGGFKS